MALLPCTALKVRVEGVAVMGGIAVTAKTILSFALLFKFDVSVMATEQLYVPTAKDTGIIPILSVAGVTK